MHDGEVVFYFESQCTTLSKIGNNIAPKLVKLKASRVSAYGFRIRTSHVNGVQSFSTLVACKGALSALKYSRLTTRSGQDHRVNFDDFQSYRHCVRDQRRVTDHQGLTGQILQTMIWLACMKWKRGKAYKRDERFLPSPSFHTLL